jgi:4-aminobutyrate aminotransferase
MAALAATGNKKYLDGFGPPVDGFDQVPYGDLEAVKKAVGPQTGAILVEPIQGEGGYLVPDDAFLPRLREICDRNGILLIADEVQSGAGRSGKMWAIQHWDVEPDILLTAKGIASGMPIGAMVAKADVMSWGPGAHGSTYGGNPVALAALLETVRLLEEGLVANAVVRGEEAQRGLRPLLEQYPALVRDVRGKGLMIGIEFDSPETADAVQLQAFERGLLVLEAGDDAIRMSPPLVVSEAEMATAIRIFGEAVGHVARERERDIAEVREIERAGLAAQAFGASGR